MRKWIIGITLVLFPFVVWGGVDLDGTNDYIDCGTDSSLDAIGNNYTISAWIYPTTIDSTARYIVCKTSSADPYIWIFYIQSGLTYTNTIRFAADYGTDDLQHFSVDNAINLNEWQSVILTWDGGSVASNVHIFVNGVEVSYDQAQDGSGTSPSDSGANLYIGNRQDISRPVDGQITEVAIWNVVLTAQEIKQLAKSRVKRIPLQIRPANLKLYLPLDDGANGATTPTTARDYSGNGNDGTLTNSPVWKAEEVLSYPE